MRFPTFLSFIGFAVLAIQPAAAQEPKWHSTASLIGESKYGDDFKHYDYVNPDAPKGGTLNSTAAGTFDSFNSFIIKGNPAAGVQLIYDTLLVHSHDEPFSMYGLLAESVETPPDRSWVSFRVPCCASTLASASRIRSWSVRTST